MMIRLFERYPTIEERLDAYSSLRVPRVEKIMNVSWNVTDVGHRGRLAHTLFTPWTVRSGKLESREKSFVSGFDLPKVE